MSKKKRQGHYCRICGQYKANEKFSGRGHARHVCKACAKRGDKPPEIEFEPPVFIEVDNMDFGIEPDIDQIVFCDDDIFFLDELTEPSPKPKKRKKPNKAKMLRSTQKKAGKALLSEILADGDVKVSEIEKLASGRSIPGEALRRAKASLGIRSIVTESGSVWHWPQRNNQAKANTDSTSGEKDNG